MKCTQQSQPNKEASTMLSSRVEQRPFPALIGLLEHLEQRLCNILPFPVTLDVHPKLR